MVNYKDIVIFEKFHENQLNRYFHYIGLSLITLSLLGILYQLDIRILNVNWMIWLLIIYMAYDLLFFPRFAVPGIIIGSILLIIGTQFSLFVNSILFGIGWFFQFWGHYHEKKPPAFLTHLKHGLVGPHWLVSQTMKFWGKNAPEGWHPGNLNPDLNDLVRLILGSLIPMAAKSSEKKIDTKISTYHVYQQQLKKQYGISDQKVEPYNDETRKRIEELAKTSKDTHFIYTSGSTSAAKKILYTSSRLKKFKQFTTRSTIQAFAKGKVTRPSLFILASLQKDNSFTSLVLTKNAENFSYLWGLKDPSIYLFHPALQPLIRDFGANSVRLWLMVLSNPALVYSTNPSTLAVFLKEIDQNWLNLTSLIRANINQYENLRKKYPMDEVMKVAQRVASSHYEKRFSKIAKSLEPIPLNEMIPGMKCYCCWNGGYVIPFLKQIRQRIPANILYIPMFSMSTETIQTELVLEKGEFCFLPLADDVYYEFICVEEHLHGKEPFNLLAPWELKAGQEYLMVVSDCYGLIRYQTEDIFLCRKIVRGLPDLIFKRRAGLAYSFTGEKITGEQLLEVFHSLEETNPYLNTNAAQLTLFPSLKDEKDLPGYKLVIAFSGKSPTALDENQITIDFEEALSSINKEFRDKRASGRLKQTEVIPFHYDQLAMLLGNHSDKENGLTSRAWESQFKLMPLNQTLWETVIAKR